MVIYGALTQRATPPSTPMRRAAMPSFHVDAVPARPPERRPARRPRRTEGDREAVVRKTVGRAWGRSGIPPLAAMSAEQVALVPKCGECAARAPELALHERGAGNGRAGEANPTVSTPLSKSRSGRKPSLLVPADSGETRRDANKGSGWLRA